MKRREDETLGNEKTLRGVCLGDLLLICACLSMYLSMEVLSSRKRSCGTKWFSSAESDQDRCYNLRKSCNIGYCTGLQATNPII